MTKCGSVTNELEVMWKEAVVYFKAESKYMAKTTKKDSVGNRDRRAAI